jgi:hypothetical protein
MALLHTKGIFSAAELISFLNTSLIYHSFTLTFLLHLLF